MFVPSYLTSITSGSWIVSRVASSASPQLLLSGSSYGRRGAEIHNHSSASLYIAPFPGVTANFFAVKIPSGSYYEMPKPVTHAEVWGVWDGANGFAMVSDRQSSE